MHCEQFSCNMQVNGPLQYHPPQQIDLPSRISFIAQTIQSVQLLGNQSSSVGKRIMGQLNKTNQINYSTFAIAIRKFNIEILC